MTCSRNLRDDVAVTRLQRGKADRMQHLSHRWRLLMVLFLVVGSTATSMWQIGLKPLLFRLVSSLAAISQMI